jgi:hypothetical protein
MYHPHHCDHAAPVINVMIFYGEKQINQACSQKVIFEVHDTVSALTGNCP